MTTATPSIRVNTRVPFPSLVKGGAFTKVSKSNGVWTITADYTLLGLAPALNLTQLVAIQDTAAGTFLEVPIGYLNNTAQRVITAAGLQPLLASDVIVLLNKSPSGASTLSLPAVASHLGGPIIVKDITGDAASNNITVAPQGPETIDGVNAPVVISTNHGSLKIYPLASGGGWFTL